jgi:hypothetical protein
MMNMDKQKLKEQAQDLRLALSTFKRNHQEFLASFDLKEVMDAFSAFMEMGNIDAIFDVEPGIPIYLKSYEETLLTLYDRGAIVPVSPITDLGLKDLEEMRKKTGIGAESLPTPAAPAPTAAELLEAEVRHDFATIRSDEMRKKRQGNREYEATYQRIASTLGSSTTGLFDATAGRYVGQ